MRSDRRRSDRNPGTPCDEHRAIFVATAGSDGRPYSNDEMRPPNSSHPNTTGYQFRRELSPTEGPAPGTRGGPETGPMISVGSRNTGRPWRPTRRPPGERGIGPRAVFASTPLFHRQAGGQPELVGQLPVRGLRQHQAGHPQDFPRVRPGRPQHANGVVTDAAGHHQPVMVGQDDRPAGGIPSRAASSRQRSSGRIRRAVRRIAVGSVPGGRSTQTVSSGWLRVTISRSWSARTIGGFPAHGGGAGSGPGWASCGPAWQAGP